MSKYRFWFVVQYLMILLICLLISSDVAFAEIYGDDNRKDANEVSNFDQLNIGNNIAFIVQAGAINTETNDLTTTEFILKNIPPNESGVSESPRKICRDRGLEGMEGDKFYGKSHVDGFEYRTGFLIEKNLLVTAGHSFNQQGIQNFRAVFGYKQIDVEIQDPNDSNKMILSQKVETEFTDEQIYNIGKIIAYSAGEFNPAIGDFNPDYAVLELDRNVQLSQQIEPLTLNQSEKLEVGTQVGAIGYPLGMPIKYIFDELTTIKSFTENGFYHNIDIFGGLSGAPVLNKSNNYVVEGIVAKSLFSTTQRYPIIESRQCALPRRLENDVDPEKLLVSQFLPDYDPLKQFAYATTISELFNGLTIKKNLVIDTEDKLINVTLRLTADKTLEAIELNDIWSGIRTDEELSITQNGKADGRIIRWEIPKILPELIYIFRYEYSFDEMEEIPLDSKAYATIGVGDEQTYFAISNAVNK